MKRAIYIFSGAVVLAAAAFGGVSALTPEPETQVRYVELAPEKTAAPVEAITTTPTPAEAPVPVEEPAPAPAPAPPAPDLCPPGTSSQASDGYNDLRCAPDVCLTLRGLPDPAHPECDYFHEPGYYR